jgi:Leucine-rich repeat (LRR) protein
MLQELQTLNIDSNELNKLPPELINLKNLQHLALKKNPLLKDDVVLLRLSLPLCEVKF